MAIVGTPSLFFRAVFKTTHPAICSRRDVLSPSCQPQTAVSILIDDVSLNMFTNICRGLFEKDKMLYAFMIAVGILRQAKQVHSTSKRDVKHVHP